MNPHSTMELVHRRHAIRRTKGVQDTSWGNPAASKECNTRELNLLLRQGLHPTDSRQDRNLR